MAELGTRVVTKDEEIAAQRAQVQFWRDKAESAERTLAETREELAGMRDEAEKYRMLSTPEIHDFMIAVEREAAHQRERWGNKHDDGKTPEDWLWLIAYLATKAAQASRYRDSDKYLHHIITCAAAACNWHANATGASTAMRAGASEATAALSSGQDAKRRE